MFQWESAVVQLFSLLSYCIVARAEIRIKLVRDKLRDRRCARKYEDNSISYAESALGCKPYASENRH